MDRIVKIPALYYGGGALTEHEGEERRRDGAFPCAYGSHFIYSRLTTIILTLTLTRELLLPFATS